MEQLDGGVCSRGGIGRQRKSENKNLTHSYFFLQSVYSCFRFVSSGAANNLYSAFFAGRDWLHFLSRRLLTVVSRTGLLLFAPLGLLIKSAESAFYFSPGQSNS